MTESTSTTVPVGTLHEVKSKDPVQVIRPDGYEVQAFSDGKVAQHVLDVPGVYVIDGKTVEAK